MIHYYSRRDFLELTLAGSAGLSCVGASAAEPGTGPSMSTSRSSNLRHARKPSTGRNLRL